MHTILRESWPLPLAGPSAAADRARTAFAAAIASATPVLIVADRGLDVASIATAIHERSRPGTPLVVVECGIADARDVERELFGARVRISRRSAQRRRSCGRAPARSTSSRSSSCRRQCSGGSPAFSGIAKSAWQANARRCEPA
jgi:hypothetical protein